MSYATRSIGIYKALYYTDRAKLSKTVLDCGAGGANPPLMIFHSAGYKTTGIDISQDAIAKARAYQSIHQIDLGIIESDMRELPYNSNTYGCCYSFNSVFHMIKVDIEKSIREMIRVTEPGGMVFFNLLSVRDSALGEGKEIEHNTFLDVSSGNIHAYHDDNEIEPVLDECEILEKVFTNSLRSSSNGTIDQSFIEYYCQKKSDKH